MTMALRDRPGLSTIAPLWREIWPEPEPWGRGESASVLLSYAGIGIHIAFKSAGRRIVCPETCPSAIIEGLVSCPEHFYAPYSYRF
jgi:hypothetical protein